MNDKKYEIKKDDLGFFIAKPTPSKEDLTKYYTEKYFKNCSSYSYEKNKDEINLENLDSLLKLQSILNALGYLDNKKLETGKKQNLFEIGSGEGHFLNFFDSIKLFKTTGIDFSNNQSKYSFEDETKFISSNNPVKEFFNNYASDTDILVLNHVVEHVPDPEDLLSDLSKYLKKDCFLLITVPNDFSKLQKYLKDRDLINKEYWIAPPEHLNYFNINSMNNLFKKYSFQVLDFFGDYPIEMFNLNQFTNYSLNPKIGKEAHNLRCKTATYLLDMGVEPNDLLNLSRSLAKCDLSRSISYICKSNNH